MPAPKRLKARKLLIASAGVAAVSYVGCFVGTSGNLMGPPPCDDAGCGGGGIASSSSGHGNPDAGCADGSADAGCK